MSPNDLRIVLAVLGALWIVGIVWSHRRRRVQGERLDAPADRSRRGQRREPSMDPEAGIASPDPVWSERSRSAAAAIESARGAGRGAAAALDTDLADELERLSREIAGDLPLVQAPRKSEPRGGATPERADGRRARIEPTFGGAAADAEPKVGDNAGDAGVSGALADPEERRDGPARSHFGDRGDGPYDRLVTLFVVAAPGEEISGYELVVATEKCGLEYGAKEVYHRLMDGRPESGPVFSVANMTKPGSFDLATITSLSTPGLTFFMTLPGPMRALDAWDTMLPTAQRMAELLGAQVLDEEHNALGRQRIQHIRDDLRDYDRKLERQTIKRPW